jgi:hypothetical protein
MQLQDQNNNSYERSSVESDSDEEIMIPVERGEGYCEMGTLEYGDHEGINIPIINTHNSNVERMRKREDIDIKRLDSPHLFELKGGDKLKRPRRGKNISRVLVQDFA